MAESIESLGRQTTVVVDLKTDSIVPDPMNPNALNSEVMDALKADILENGFVQPILVRPHEGKYRCIDGEHRWRVLSEAGAETVPCIIDDAGEDDARLRLMSMNRLRGEFEPVALAKVLANLSDTVGEEELRRRLGMDETEYEDAIAGTIEVPEIETEQTAPEIMTWRFGLPEYEVVEAALQSQIEAGAESRAEAMIALLS